MNCVSFDFNSIGKWSESPNEFYFTNSNGNISPGAVTGGNLMNLATVEKTKRKNIMELQYCTGMSRREI